MASRGSSTRTKSDFGAEVSAMGATYETLPSREYHSYSIDCLKEDSGRALNLLGDSICNMTFNAGEFETLREEVSGKHEANHTRYEETTLENVHFNGYRDHMMGQPVKGDRDNLYNISIDQLQAYHSANYFGDNIVVVATGDVNHAQIVE